MELKITTEFININTEFTLSDQNAPCSASRQNVPKWVEALQKLQSGST